MHMIGSLLTPWVVPTWLEYRITLIFGSAFMGLSLLLVGPAELSLMVLGLFLFSSFLGPSMIPVMPEMISATKEAFP